jgi:hypothetical protein
MMEKEGVLAVEEEVVVVEVAMVGEMGEVETRGVERRMREVVVVEEEVVGVEEMDKVMDGEGEAVEEVEVAEEEMVMVMVKERVEVVAGVEEVEEEVVVVVVVEEEEEEEEVAVVKDGVGVEAVENRFFFLNYDILHLIDTSNFKEIYSLYIVI